MKRRKLIPGFIKPGPAGDHFKVFLKADAEMHKKEFEKWKTSPEERPTPRYVGP